MKNPTALDILDACGAAMTRRCVVSGAGMAVLRLLPQAAGYASNVSEARHPHVFQYTLRWLRSSRNQPAFAHNEFFHKF